MKRNNFIWVCIGITLMIIASFVVLYSIFIKHSIIGFAIAVQGALILAAAAVLYTLIQNLKTGHAKIYWWGKAFLNAKRKKEPVQYWLITIAKIIGIIFLIAINLMFWAYMTSRVLF